MKILMICNTFPPHGFGGTTAVSYSLAVHLRQRGHEVTVFTTDIGNYLNSRLNVHGLTQLNGIRVKYHRNVSNLLAFKYRLAFPLGMFDSLTKEIQNFDVIHVHGYRGFKDVIIDHLANKKGVPYVLQAHDSLLAELNMRRFKQIYDVVFGYRFLDKTSQVIALSKLEAQEYRYMGIPNEKISVIPNGIDLCEFAELPVIGLFKAKFKLPKEKKIILCLGRLHKTKGLDFLIKSYANLRKNKKAQDSILVFAGPDDGYFSEAKSLINSLKLSETVYFTGRLNPFEKICAFVDSTVVICPEESNVFLLVPLEAAACRKPVIVSSGNCISEQVREGQFGYSVEYGNIFELSEKMSTLLSDSKLSEKLGEKGRDFVFNNHDWTKIIVDLEKVYHNATKT